MLRKFISTRLPNFHSGELDYSQVSVYFNRTTSDQQIQFFKVESFLDSWNQDSWNQDSWNQEDLNHHGTNEQTF